MTGENEDGLDVEDNDSSKRDLSLKNSPEIVDGSEVSSSPSEHANTLKHEAAVRLQRVYKSFRTRRRLADCAVLLEQHWWKVLDFALLRRNSVSFFDIEEPETVVSKWSRARTKAAKVGKGLSKDKKAQKLALQHWLEAIDPRHRYGHNLHFYYVSWLQCESKQPFFYWLDVGDGKEINHDRCPRSRLQQQCIKYLGPKERENYQVVVKNGKFVNKQTGELLDTSQSPKDSKWIFVLSTMKKLYVGQKKKGTFQHSSFLAGGATSAAGRLVVEQGILRAVWPHSGHYRPTEENFQELVSFFEENKVDLTDVKKNPTEDDEESYSTSTANTNSTLTETKDEDQEEDSEVQKPCGEGKHETSNSSDIKSVEQSCNGGESKNTSAFKRIYALYIQNLFREFEGDSESESDEEDEEGEEKKEGGTGENSISSGKECMKKTNNNSTTESEDIWHGTEEENVESSSEQFEFQWNLFDDDEHNEIIESVMTEELMLNRINSKKGLKSLQLGKQLSRMWTTGAGPRIGSVRDYPTELQFQALEDLNLSPRKHPGFNGYVCWSPLRLTPRSPGPGASILKETKMTGALCRNLDVSDE